MNTNLKESKSSNQQGLKDSEQLSYKPILRSYRKVVFGVLDETSPNYGFTKNTVKLTYLRKFTTPQSFQTMRSLKASKVLKFLTKMQIMKHNPQDEINAMKYYLYALRKANKVQEYELHIANPFLWMTSNQGRISFMSYWSLILKHLRSSFIEKVKIYVKYYTHKGHRVPLEETLWWQMLVSRLVAMNKIRLFYLAVIQEDSRFFNQKPCARGSMTIPKSREKLKRLRRMKNIVIQLENALDTLELESFHTTLLSFPALEILTIRIPDRQQFYVFEALSKCQNLNTLQLSGNIKASDFMHILAEIPKLYELECRDNWSFKEELLYKSYNFPNVHKLCLERSETNLSSANEKPYLTFLKGFSSINTLEINLRWNETSNFIEPYATVLANFKNLKALTLGISFTSLLNIADFFQIMKALNSLKHFTLLAYLSFSLVNYQQPMRLISPFEEFLKEQTDLESLEMFWNKVNVPFLQETYKSVLSLKQKMKFMKIAFSADDLEKLEKDRKKIVNESNEFVSKNENIENIVIEMAVGDNSHLQEKLQESAIKHEQNSQNKHVSVRITQTWRDLPCPW